MCESVQRKLGHTTVANPYFFYSGGSMRKSDQQHHSTFFVQSLFFLLVFVENMLLASWPLIKGRASERMSGEKSLLQILRILPIFFVVVFEVIEAKGGRWVKHFC